MWMFATAAVTWAAEDFQDATYWVGDLHVHTGLSGDGQSSDLGDGCNEGDDCGAFGEVLQIAADNGLDFVSITDHINAEWALADEDFDTLWATQTGAVPDGLLVVPGVELAMGTSEPAPLGHKNLYLFADDEGLANLDLEDLRWNGVDVEIDSCEAGWDWLDALEERVGPLALLPHHPAGSSPMPVDWSCHDTRWQPAVEVYSRHGNATQKRTVFDPPMSGIVETGTVEHALDPTGFGHRMGFIGATDAHDTSPGRVCVDESDRKYGGGLTLAVLPAGEPLTRTGVYDALTERRTIATSGPVLPVAVTYRSGETVLGGLGDDLAVDHDRPLHVDVQVPTEHASFVLGVDLITPTETAAAEVSDEGWVGTLGKAPVWVYVRVRVDGAAWWSTRGGCHDAGVSDEERLWLSPSWRSTPGPVSDTGGQGDSGADSGKGCGCGAATPASVAWLALLPWLLGRSRPG